MRITRLAPSPTGALHLGNARTFLMNWLLAVDGGWRIILRIEDLDGPRVKSGADKQAIEDLKWLGLTWDEGPIYQSTRKTIYDAAIEKLIAGGGAYPCICSRSEAEDASSAPHAEDGSAVYPGTCRGRFATMEEARAAAGARGPCVRFEVEDGVVEFQDMFRGRQQVDVGRLGDFVIAKSDGSAAYHLAVVVDDAEMNVTDVVRGDDLVESAGRQILLNRALGLENRIPRYWHLPLVVGADGRRLAKRHGDTRIDFYRQRGVEAGRVLALLAKWCGIEAGEEMSAAELRGKLDLERVARRAINFTERDDAFLLGGERKR